MQWVLSQTKPRQLERKIGVVSFYEETARKHLDLTKSAVNSNDALATVNVQPMIVSQHADLVGLPPCNTFVMYVDYNQRNVILEDPKWVLGDLRLTAARAIKKLNGECLRNSSSSSLTYAVYDYFRTVVLSKRSKRRKRTAH